MYLSPCLYVHKFLSLYFFPLFSFLRIPIVHIYRDLSRNFKSSLKTTQCPHNLVIATDTQRVIEWTYDRGLPMFPPASVISIALIYAVFLTFDFQFATRASRYPLLCLRTFSLLLFLPSGLWRLLSLDLFYTLVNSIKLSGSIGATHTIIANLEKTLEMTYKL